MARRWLIAGAMLLAGICGASAQSWPTKALRIIVPVSAGSATDVTAAHNRRTTVAAARPDRAGREPHRRWRHHRHGLCRQAGRGRRLHHPGAFGGLRASARDVSQSRLRLRQGFRRRDAARQRAAGDDRLAGQIHDPEATGRRREGEAQFGQLLQRRLWRSGASGRGAAADVRRIRGAADLHSAAHRRRSTRCWDSGWISSSHRRSPRCRSSAAASSRRWRCPAPGARSRCRTCRPRPRPAIPTPTTISGSACGCR